MTRDNEKIETATQLAVLANRLKVLETTVNDGVKKVESFAQKTIEEKTQAALLGQKIILNLEKLNESLTEIRTDLDTHKDAHEKRLKANEQKTNIALVWLAFLTIFVFALLLFIASGSSGARVAGEFTGGLINSVKP